MNRFLMAVVVSILIATSAVAAEPQQKDRMRLDKIEQSLKADVPRVLCLDNSFATGGQPSEQAFAKIAASGFHSVLSLRAAGEGIDLTKERALVEKTGLRYFNIPVVSSAPRTEQAEEFIRLVKEKSNHPMFINCASANRVGAFMMIYRVVEQGWSEDKALDEALKIGLRGDELKKFAQSYIAQNKAKRG
ncbi:MAG TPA: protein tyrosine phosphatase family protein [Candidatus Binatia bacterium]|nr:protein tyrosine phosphatase family protein [Candidatus Binatia bacterium]